MKTLLTLLVITSSSIYGQEITEKEGVIRQITCNSPSGLGIIKLERKKNRKTLVIDYLLVDSYELCGTKPNAFSVLGSIGYDAVLLGINKLYKVTLDGLFVKKIEEIEEVNYYRFTKKVRKYEKINSREANAWFNSGPTNIPFVKQEQIDKMVEEYTSEEYVQKFFQ